MARAIAESLGSATLPVTVTDTASQKVLEYSPSSLSVDEGSNAKLSVSLTEQPTGNVTVTLSGFAAGITASPSSLKFTASDYKTTKSFTIAAAADDNTDNETSTVTISASGGGYNSVSASLTVASVDAGVGSIVLTPASLRSGVSVSEGSTATVGVQLSAVPTGDVTVSLSGAGSGISASPTSLTFTTGNYNTAQSFTLSAAQDADGDDERVTLTMSSSGGGYTDSLKLTAVANDDEEPGAELPPVATITALTSGNSAVPGADKTIPPDGKIKVSFSTPVGSCSNEIAGVCQDTVTRWTSIDETTAAELFSLTRVGYFDGAETPHVPFTAAISGNQVTLTPTGLSATVDANNPKLVRIYVANKFWNASSGRRGRSTLETFEVRALPSQAKFSVSDASTTESPGAHLPFTVSLSRPVQSADGTVSVDYATRDGTAKAGSDYRALSGTLAFAVGEQKKTVSVPVFEDVRDDDGETLDLLLSNPVGAVIADGAGAGTIGNSEPVGAPWLARFGRTVAGQILDGIKSRLRSARTPGGEADFAGHGSLISDNSLETASSRSAIPKRGIMTDSVNRIGEEPADAANVLFADANTGGIGELQAMSSRDALLGSSFVLTGDEDTNGGSLAMWGRMARAGFKGSDGALSLDGTVTTGLIGADYGRDDWLLGIAVSHTGAKGGYTVGSSGSGTAEATLTAATLYGSREYSGWLELWGAAGHGLGKLTFTPIDEGVRTRSDLSWSMAAGGMRTSLIEPEDRRNLTLALFSDAMWARTSSGAVHTGSMLAGTGEVTVVRLGIEGSLEYPLEGGGMLKPALEIGLRHDSGDAETGLGVEMGGSLEWTDPSFGVSV